MSRISTSACNATALLGLTLVTLLSPAVAQEGHGLDIPVEPPIFRPDPERKEGPPPVSLVPPEEGSDPRDTPPPTFYGEEIDAESDALVYVLDFSCSMSLMEPNPYQVDGVVYHGTRRQRLLAEVASSLDSLAESFRFTIVRYGTAFVAWRPSLQQATPENKLAAVTWLMGTRCLGLTITGPATVYGLSIPGHEHIILFTDGEPNWDGASKRPPEWHRVLIRNRNETGATIDVFGLRPMPVARRFCRGVASDSGGTYVEID